MTSPNINVGLGTLQNLIQIGGCLYFTRITGNAFSEPTVSSPGPKLSHVGSAFSVSFSPLRHGDCSRIVEAQFQHRKGVHIQELQR